MTASLRLNQIDENKIVVSILYTQVNCLAPLHWKLKKK